MAIIDKIILRESDGTVSYDIAVDAANVNGTVATAEVATKVGTATIGSKVKPIYVEEGVPTECDSTLEDIVTTTSTTLNNSESAPLEFVSLTGNTEQKSYSGKNLFNINGDVNVRGNDLTPSTYNSVSNGVLTTQANTASNMPCGQLIENVNGKSIAVSAKLVSTGTGGQGTLMIYENGEIAKYIAAANVNTIMEMVYTCITDFVVVTFGTGGGTGAQFTDIQVEVGEVATEYEPYCGGIFSPNPYYPQAIENTGDCVEMENGTIAAADGSLANSSNRIRTKYHVPCKAGDEITITRELAITSRVYYYDKNKNFMSSSAGSTVTQSTTYIIPSGVYYFKFVFSQDDNFTVDDVGKITLTINDKYVGCVKTHGKNKLGGLKFGTRLYEVFGNEFDTTKKTVSILASTASGKVVVDDIFKENTQYTFILYGYNNALSNATNLLVVYTDGTSDRLSFSAEGGAGSYCVFTSDTGKTIASVKGNYISGTSNFYYEKCGIFEGALTLEDFEEYKETVAYFLTQYPMTKGSTLYKEDGLFKVEHTRVEGILNQLHSANAEIAYIMLSNLGNNALCSHFKYNNNEAITSNNNASLYLANGEFAIRRGTADRIYFKNSDFTTLDEWTAWLTENSVIVQYTLATPTIEILDEESQVALNNLKSFASITYIESDNRVKASEIKSRYAVSYAGARIMENTYDIDQLEDRANESEIKESSDYDLVGTKEGGYRLIELEGNTVQDGTPSPSTPFPLLSTGDCVEFVNGMIQDSGAEVYSPIRIVTKNKIPCKKGDVVKVQSDLKNKYIVYYDSKGSFISYSAFVNTEEITIGVECSYFRIEMGDGTVAITPQTVGKIQLTINGKYVGMVKTSLYEYIEMEQGTLNSNNGANFDDANTKRVRSQSIVTCNGGDVVTVEIEKQYKLGVRYFSNGVFASTGGPDGGDVLAYSHSFTIPTNCNGFRFVLANDNFTFTPQTVGKITIKINGEVKFTNIKTIAYFLTTYPLMQGSTLYKENGLFKVEHKYMRFNADGNSSVGAWGSSYPNLFKIYLAGAKATTSDIMCSHFQSFNSVGDVFTNDMIYTTDNTLNINHMGSSSAVDLNVWLSKNPIYGIAPRITPIIETLDTASQIALNSLETFDEVTYIEVDSRVKPSSIKGKYGTSQVGALTLEALNNSEKHIANDIALEAKINELAVALVATGSEV